jgi:hypothetical protein
MMVLSDLGVYKFIAKSWTFDENVKMEIRQALDHCNLRCKHEDMAAELARCSKEIV